MCLGLRPDKMGTRAWPPGALPPHSPNSDAHSTLGQDVLPCRAPGPTEQADGRWKGHCKQVSPEPVPPLQMQVSLFAWLTRQHKGLQGTDCCCLPYIKHQAIR